MQYQGGKRATIIAASTAEEFQQKLNKELTKLDSKKIKYELTFNNQMGFCAYIVSQHTVMVPEDLEDEFELIGISCKCKQCPKWVHPTKGNVKYTHCPVTGRLCSAESKACEQFYEWLRDGEVEIEEENADVQEDK